MDSQRVREKFDKLPPKRKQVLLKVLADESKQKIALELCDGSEQAVQQHLRQLYKDFYIQVDRERKLPALIQLFVRCMPELINNRVPGAINDLPDDRGTAKLHQESDEMTGTSASELSPEQIVLDQSQPNYFLPGIAASYHVETSSIEERYIKATNKFNSLDTLERKSRIQVLEEIAKDSSRYHGKVMEFLADFVRANAPWKKEEEEQEERSTKIRDDIQAALTVIGGRKPYINKGILDLRNTDLRGANLREAQLQRINLKEAQLQGADLWKADLQSAHLAGANLKEVELSNANLQEANLWKADLQGANLWKADLQGAILYQANLKDVELRGAKLHRQQIKDAVGDSKTILPEHIERPAHWNK